MPTEHTTVVQNTRSTTNRLHEFDPTSYDWDDWEILFDTYISVEGVTNDTKKRNLLITALGVQPFKTLISICKPKPGGKVHICTDLSTGANKPLDIDQYSLPRPEELFVALNVGTQFTKINFSEADLHVKLDDDSKELLAINTHKGLFRSKRPLFGTAFAPSIFQKKMNQILAELDGMVCYLDDISANRTNATSIEPVSKRQARTRNQTNFDRHTKKRLFSHENQIRYRHWSSNNDIIATSSMRSHSSHSSHSLHDTRSPDLQHQPPDKEMSMLHRSTRHKRPLHRSIEET